MLRFRKPEAADMSTGIRSEWRLFIRAPASILLLAVFAVLACIGAINGVQRVIESRQLASQALDADAKSFAAKRTALADLEAGKTVEGQFGSPRKAHQAILSAARPLVPPAAELPVLSAGPRPTPELLRVSILTRHVDQQPRLDDPSNRLDGAFDLVFVTTWLLPLFALVLGCDVLAGDRERGRAALLASQGTALNSILRSRLLIRFAALFAIVAVVGAASVIATEWTDLVAALAPLAFWLIGVALFLIFWFTLAAAVNVFARSAATAALALLCLWVGFSVVIPALAGSVVQVFAPPPDRLQGVLALRDTDADLNRRREQVTAAYYAAAPQNKPVRQGDEYERYFVTELYPRHLAFDSAYTPVAARMDQARVRQAQLLRFAGALSPTLAFRLLTEDLAGSAPERRIAFLESVDRFQHEWRRHFDHKLASMRPLTLADYDEKPEFAAAPEPAAARWRRVGLVLAMLLILPAVAFIFTVRRSRLATPSGAH
jgi:ABC-2 type transport system permease protein